MGNCQAIDAAALVIQHPSGKIERLYWPVSVSEVMKTNPGHYVSLIIPLPASEDDQDQDKTKTVRFTRVKLLRPTDTLALGHAYRLVTTQGTYGLCLKFWSVGESVFCCRFDWKALDVYCWFFRGYEGVAGKKVCQNEAEAGGGISWDVTDSVREADSRLWGRREVR